MKLQVLWIPKVKCMYKKALNEIINLQTTFVIAHRLSTIKNATYICVVEDGKITESGTHNELMKRGGKYQYLYSLQFRDD